MRRAGAILGQGQGPLCVCVPHIPAHFVVCAACEARRSLERGGRGRHAPQVADPTAAHRRVCVIAGLMGSGMPASTGRREQSVCFFAGGRAGVPHQNVGRVVQALDERPRGRGTEHTLRLAALIRCLCCATVSVPMEMPRTVVRVRPKTDQAGRDNRSLGV